MPSLTAKGRISLCLFSYEDGRRCRTPRIGTHPHFCFYHAQKESQSQTTEKLAKELAYFFSGDYLSANDLNTAVGRLIPAIIRGQIKPRVARTVAYMFQTLMQSTRLAQHEYINAFGTDGWRDAVYTSVTSNHDYLYPPDPNAPQPDPEDESEDESEDEFDDNPEPEDDEHLAPPTSPAQQTPSTPVGAGLARPASPTEPDRPTQPPPQPQPSAAATSALPATPPPTLSSARPTPADTEAALNIARSIFPDRADATPPQTTTPTTNPTPTQTDQPNTAPPAATPTSQPRRRPGEPNRDPYAVHFDHTHRLMVDGKPW